MMQKVKKSPAKDEKQKPAKKARKHSSPAIKELMDEMKVESEGEPVQAWQKGQSIKCEKNTGE